VTDIDVLVVGAGPTGLALAASLCRHGIRPRIVDANADRAHESRALGVQPRTLEVLDAFGLAEPLAARGNPGLRLTMHAGGRVVTALPLFDLAMADTAHPYLLVVSQAVTEQVLIHHLVERGVQVQRRVELIDLVERPGYVECTLRRPDGGVERLTARYAVGCDGGNSTVRAKAGIPFSGGDYPQSFALADLAVDGLTPDSLHAYVADDGLLLFFPLGDPAPWRLITMRPAGGWPDAPAGDRTRLADLQAAADRRAGPGLRLRDPVWISDFRLRHRHAARYRSGRLFLAGDAAHVHSPVGAQGMNTGIQDAVNLGWKLAYVLQGAAAPALLDSYDAERRPVGRAVVRLTDRGYAAVTSDAAVPRLVRRRVVPRLAPLLLRLRRPRALGFRAIGELSISYRRSPAVADAGPGRWGTVRAGDRLPDVVARIDGEPRRLHHMLRTPGLHVLLCPESADWDQSALAGLHRAYGGLLTAHRADAHRLIDGRVREPVHYLVRPDGHIAYRGPGTDLGGLARFLAAWFRPAPVGSQSGSAG
jgi:2-polyprenyl-6-methoxyphenol hydroxylase-like FAD-dependent oxidoreductase